MTGNASFFLWTFTVCTVGRIVCQGEDMGGVFHRESFSFGGICLSAKAVIDIGTNSIKLLVMKGNGRDGEILADCNRIVRLGDRLRESGLLSPEAMDRALSAVRDMAGEARRLEAAEIAVVGTQALRAAANADDFIGSVGMLTGLTVDVLDGEDEASLSFLAALSSIEERRTDCRTLCMFDVGGGSSEIVMGDMPHTPNLSVMSGHLFRCSLPVGALTLHDMFFRQAGFAEDACDNRTAIGRAGAYVRRVLAEADGTCRKESFHRHEGARPFGCCVGIGGTVVTLASVMLALDMFDSAAISGVQLSVGEIDRQMALFALMCPEDRSEIRGLAADRSDIILAGTCVVREMLVHFGFSSLTVSDRGLRYGVMMKRFGIR